MAIAPPGVFFNNALGYFLSALDATMVLQSDVEVWQWFALLMGAIALFFWLRQRRFSPPKTAWESNVHLRDRALAASCNGIVISDARQPDLPVIYVNPAFERITGYSAAEVLGKNCRFLKGSDCDQPELTQLRAALQAGKPCIVILRNYRRDGTLFWNELSISPIYDSSGTLTHFIGIQTDVTERKQFEAALQQAKDQMRAILDAVPGVVSWINSDLRYIEVNRHLAATFNLPPEDFVNQQIGFIKHRSSAQFAELMAHFFASSTAEISQETVVEVDNQERNYLLVAQKYDRDRAAFSVGIDITERKQAEEALRATTSRLTALMANLQASVLVKDEWQRVVLINQTFCDTFGIATPPSELIGTDFSEFSEQQKCRFAEPEKFVQRWTEILKNRQVVTNEELLLADGRTFERDYVPIFVEENYCGNLWMYRDITQRKQAEKALLVTQEELRQALAKEKELNELKSRFISMTSHEFRTPLSTILSSAELLEHYRHKWTEEKQLSHIQRIQIAVNHMVHLLNDVLIAGKAEAGKLEASRTRLNLEKFCRELVEEIQLSSQNQHEIAFSCQGKCTDCYLDEKLLRQILSNLLSNALKYSPLGSAVTFQLACQELTVDNNCSQGEQVVIFQIQDQGIGIPVGERELLFDSFYRATNASHIPGTGLGLTIVKRCVEAHGGQISVNSTGVGTTFTVTLPMAVEDRKI